MAKLLRVVVLAVFSFAWLVVAGRAYAGGSVAVVPNQQIWQASAFGLTSSFNPSQGSAFSDLVDKVTAANPPGGGTSYCAPLKSVLSDGGAFTITIRIQYMSNGSPTGCGANPADDTRTAQWYSTRAGVCPSHASGTPTINPSSCTCDSGYKPDSAGAACIPDCQKDAVASSGYFDIGTNAGANPILLGCAGNCEVVYDGYSASGSALVGGQKHWYAKGSYLMTGGACSSTKQQTSQIGNGTAAKPDDTCAPGQAQGTVNGKTVCVDQSGDGKTPTDSSKSTGQSSTEKTKVTNADGSTTETETRTRIDVNGNKETTVTRTTTRPDGSQTVDRTVDNPLPGTTLGGNQPGTGDPNNPDPQVDECEKHPSAAGCGGTPAPVNSLYTAKTKTLSDVLTTGRTAFAASAFGTAATNFFAVSGGGTCPTATAHIAYINADLTFDQFCSSFATSALLALKVAILLVASFFAFRVAVE